MSNYKPFEQQVAELFVSQLESKTSFFHSLYGERAQTFQTPLNASTGKNYRGLNALWLAMQPHDDPRWMTLNQANKMQIKVPKGSTATLLNVVKTAESFPVLDENGKRMKDENGKNKYHTVQLQEPVEETHWLFNAAQLAVPPRTQGLASPEAGIERLGKLVAAAGIELPAHDKNTEVYDAKSGQILLPAQETYRSAIEYNAALLHQVAHWTAGADRLNREVTGEPGNADYASEELRAGLATLILGAETGIGTNHPAHYEKVIPEWVTLLKANPAELRNAVNDAQKVVDHVLELEIKLGLRKENKYKPAPLGLETGDVVNYNITSYKVTESKGNKFKIEDQQTGASIRISATDGLYKSLVQAKYRGTSAANEVKNEVSQDQVQENEMHQEQTQDRNIRR